MAVDVSRIPNNSKFDPVREAILYLDAQGGGGGGVTIIGTSPITASAVGTTVTIGINLSVVQNSASGTGSLTYSNGVFTYTPPDLTNVGIQNLQQVTTVGNTTTNNVMIGSSNTPTEALEVVGNQKISGTDLNLENPASGTNVFSIVTPINTGLAFNTGNGLNSMTFYSSAYTFMNGNLGINTFGPSYRLDVNGDARVTEGLFLDRVAGSPNIKGIGEGNIVIDSGGGSGDLLYLNAYVSDDVILAYGGGNVGIGTSSPQARLQIVNATNQQSVPAAGTGATQGVIISNDLNSYGMFVGSTGDGKGYIQQQRTDSATYYDLLIQPNGGNVGIGTTSPAEKLTVAGTAQIDGRVRLTNSNTEIYHQSNRVRVRAEGTDNVAQFADYGLFLPRTGDAFNLYVAGSASFGYSERGVVSIGSSNTERIKFDSDGDSYITNSLGIGTTSPDKNLEVYTASGTESSIRIRQASQNYWDLKSPASNTDFVISDVGGEKLRLGSNGNLTIGGSLIMGTTIQMANNDGFVYDDATNIMYVRTDGTNHKLWHQGNDGSGSGLDSDLLDGSQGSYYDHRQYTRTDNYLGGYYVSGGTEKPNSSVFGGGKLKIAMLRGGSPNLGFGGTWNDVLWMSTYNGGDVKRSTALVSSKYDNTSLWIAKQNFDSSSWGTGYLIWNSGNDGSGSGLDADLVDGLQASQFLRSDTSDTMSGNLTVNGTVINQAVQSRDKLRVWSSSTYAIGMDYRFTYGHLNDYAMTFQMSNTAARGWWWGDSSHSDAQGAMSLTTEGKLVVATSLSVGEGESITAPSANKLFVKGANYSASVRLVGSYTNTKIQMHCDVAGANTMVTFSNAGSGAPGQIVGSIVGGTTSTTYNTTSDYRIKENIVSLNDGIDRLKLLKPSRFNFIGDTEVVDGFIAHEAQEVVPQAVSGEKDAIGFDGEPIMQGIDQSKLVPLLTAALQEAVAKIEALEERITILENN